MFSPVAPFPPPCVPSVLPLHAGGMHPQSHLPTSHPQSSVIQSQTPPIHPFSPPIQYMQQEMNFFDSCPGFVAETPSPLSSNVATLHYQPQVPSCIGSRIHGIVACAGHAREGPQITRAIPEYSHPAPVFEATSSLQESYSTPEMQFSSEGSVLASVPVQTPYVVGEGLDSLQMQFPPLAAAPVEDGVLEGTIETPSEAKKLEDAIDLQEYKVFAAAFKAQREKMGYSQADVVIQIRIRYGEHISEHRLIEFEQARLHITTVWGIKRTLAQWLKDTARASGASEEEIKELFLSFTSINPTHLQPSRSHLLSP